MDASSQWLTLVPTLTTMLLPLAFGSPVGSKYDTAPARPFSKSEKFWYASGAFHAHCPSETASLPFDHEFTLLILRTVWYSDSVVTVTRYPEVPAHFALVALDSAVEKFAAEALDR